MLVRHFLDSGALVQLGKQFKVSLVFPLDKTNRLIHTTDIERFGFRAVRAGIPSRRRLLWKWKFYLDQAKWRCGEDWGMIRKGWRQMMGWKAACLFTIGALPVVRVIIDWLFDRELDRHPASDFENFMEEEKPDGIVLPSTFNGYFENDAMRLGGHRKIPVLLLMNSWDNPSTKRMLVEQPSAVVVWGPRIKQHAMRYMGMSEERVYVFGAAQFEVFRQPVVRSRKKITESHNIASDDKLILYAGSSKGNAEDKHLNLLDHAIETGLIPSAKVIYRPHPYGVSQETAQRILETRFQHIHIEARMRTLIEDLAAGRHKGFFLTPYQETHDLLSAVDMVISPLSTILIEAGLHGKPVMCMIPTEEDVGSHWVILRDLAHFRELTDHPDVITVRSMEQFLPCLKILLKRSESEEFGTIIKEAMYEFVKFPERKYADSVADLTHALVSQK